MIAVDKLISVIRQAVNEASTASDGFSSEVDALLLDFARTAAPWVLLKVPAAYQVVYSHTYDKADDSLFFERPDGMTAVLLPVPDDFCRFISMRAQEWKTSVSVIYPDSHPLFARQFSPVAGVGSGPYSPAVFLTSELTPEGSLSSHIVAHSVSAPCPFTLSYVRTPDFSGSEIDIDERLTDALAYYAAGLYLQSIGDVNGSKAANDTSLSLITNLNNIVIS